VSALPQMYIIMDYIVKNIIKRVGMAHWQFLCGRNSSWDDIKIPGGILPSVPHKKKE
jgi:hypothetical protein